MTAPTGTEPVEVVGETDSGEMRVRFPVVVIENLDTSDGRLLMPGSLSPRALPLSVLAQPASPHGGDEPAAAQVIGRIDTLQRTPGPEVISKRTGQPFPEGTFIWSGEGALDATSPIADLVRKQYLRGVSVDLTGMDFEVVGGEGFAPDPVNPRRQIVTHAAEIAAVTLVPIPAFGDCYVELADEDTVPEPLTPEDLPAGMAASGAPMWRSVDVGDVGAFIGRTKSGAVSAQARQKAAKAGHAMPDESFPIETAEDLTNAIRDIGRAKDPVAARKHIIRQAKRLGLSDRIPDGWNADGTTSDDNSMAAAGVPDLPPIDWFRDPQLPALTPLTITDDGHCFGHVAGWGTPHTGFTGRTVIPPRSASDYAYFHAGSAKVRDGDSIVEISVGHLTMDTGHADTALGHHAAASHYDHTGSLVASVCAGEDAHGIWFSGVIHPDVDELKLRKFRSCGLSGDWRRIGPGLEMIAVLSVPVPGFPVPRARVASGQPLALVAAGALKTVHHAVYAGLVNGRLDQETIASISHAVIDGLNQRDEQRQRETEFAALVTELDDTSAVVAALLAEVDDTASLTAELLAELGEADADPKVRSVS